MIQNSEFCVLGIQLHRGIHKVQGASWTSTKQVFKHNLKNAVT